MLLVQIYQSCPPPFSFCWFLVTGGREGGSTSEENFAALWKGASGAEDSHHRERPNTPEKNSQTWAEKQTLGTGHTRWVCLPAGVPWTQWPDYWKQALVREVRSLVIYTVPCGAHTHTITCHVEC